MATIAVAGALMLFLGGCATTMYDGPARSDEATIVVNGMRLLRIDSRDAPGGQVFRVAPGQHAVAVDPNDDPQPGSERWRRSGEPVQICFDARPMRLYLVRPKYEGNQWLPEVVDQRANQTIATIPTNDLRRSCETRAPGTVTSSETATARTDSVHAVRPPRPVVQLHLDAGDVTSADSDNAGDGYLLGGGVSFTPLWIDNVGLGAGLDVSFKYHPVSVGGEQGSNSSMPVLLTGHLLSGLDDGARWYLLFRGGFEKDFNRQFSFNGVTSSESSRGAGLVAEIGLIFVATNHFAVGATFRGTVIDLAAGMDHVSGSNLGILFSVYYNYVP
jgi:hypothetical protein